MKTARIERNGTGIEKNGTGMTEFIEKNGTGIERNGTGIAGFIERNGTGIRGWVRAALVGALLFGFAVSASASVRGFVEVGADTLQLTLADDIAVLTGGGTHEFGYARVALSGVSCGGHASVMIEGNGTGKTQIEGNGTGKTQIEGNGTGKTQIEGNGTGAPLIEGNGTGAPDIEGNGTGAASFSGCDSMVLIEGNGTGKTQIEGNGTGKTQIEGNGTGKTQIEGNGTGSPNAATGSLVAEIALNGQTASIIVYGISSNDALVELAVFEVPVIFDSSVADVAPIGFEGEKRILR